MNPETRIKCAEAVRDAAAGLIGSVADNGSSTIVDCQTFLLEYADSLESGDEALAEFLAKSRGEAEEEE